jgi:hypothetical protein
MNRVSPIRSEVHHRPEGLGRAIRSRALAAPVTTATPCPSDQEHDGPRSARPHPQLRSLLPISRALPLSPYAVGCDCDVPRDLSVSSADLWWDETCTDGMHCTICGGIR